MDEEKELLLNECEEQILECDRKRPTRQPYFYAYLSLIHIVLALSLLGNLYQTLTSRTQDGAISIFPELRHLGKVTKNEHATNHKAYTNYSGPPNDANAAAWKQLLQPLYFNISYTEIQAAGASPADSVRVKEGGYIASLGVYHELHCLNKMRYFLYTPPPAAKAADGEWVGHIGK